MRHIVWVFLAMLSACVEAQDPFIANIPNPREHHKGWVSDTAEFFSLEERSKLEGRLSEIEQETRAEIAVVTVGHTTTDSKSFAHQLFNRWGIGKRDVNNGVLFLLVRSQRRVEIITGTGVSETLSEGWLLSMQQASMLPHFKEGGFFQGIEAGIVLVDEQLRRSPQPAPTEGVRWWMIILGVIVAWIAIALLYGYWVRLQAGRCQRCRSLAGYRRLEGDDLVEALNPIQRTEHKIGARAYTGKRCPRCGATHIARSHSRNYKFSMCACGAESITTSHKTLREATPKKDGEFQTDTTCAHCHATTSKREALKYTPPSSTSLQSSSVGGVVTDNSPTSSDSGYSYDSGYGSGSSDSFGGGSSDGSGSGSNW